MPIDTKVRLLRNRRTKIVATLGPSSDSPELIEKLIQAGVSVFRLNMSHGEHAKHRQTFGHIRAITERLNSPVAILADLCGPKIRVGKFPGGSVALNEGQLVVVTTRDVEGNQALIPSQYQALAGDVVQGDRILLDDGNIELTVLSIEGTEISCRVLNSAILKNHKGMNLPGVNVSAPSLTEKDHADARFALELGVDFMALSFVRRAEDIQDLRKLMAELGKSAAIIAKIEKPEALENIDGIMECADGIMVARGDLGVELPPETVPLVQTQLIDRARQARKPVIVATQMLESMIDNPRPTRAEVTDVANAVHGGADAVMLSAESAAGRYPLQAVRMMDDIIRQTESYLWQMGAFGSFTASREVAKRPLPMIDAIAESTALLSRELMVRAIMVAGDDDDTAAILSASRPAAPLIVVTPSQRAMHVSNLLWGVIPMRIDPDELNQPRELARRMTVEVNLQYGQPTVLVVKGLSRNASDAEPTISVVTI